MAITVEDVKRTASGGLEKVKLGSVAGADLQGLLRDGGEVIDFGDSRFEPLEEDIASQDSFTALIDGTPVARLGTGTTEFIEGVKDVFTVQDPISKDVEHKLDNAASGTVSLVPDFEGPLPGPDPDNLRDNSNMNQELENGMGTAKTVKSVIENNTSLIIVAFFILGAIGVSLGPLDFE
jgi:hypothetical protein